MDECASLSAYASGAQFRASVAVTVRASPERALAAVRSVTLGDMPLARWMGEVRYLPGRLLGKPPASPQKNVPFLHQLEQSGTLVLKHTPEEMVTASAGKWHQVVDQEPVPFRTREEFEAFRDPEYEKLFIRLHAEPAGPGKSRLVLEHWTWALGPDAERKFARYWRVIRPTGNFVSKRMLRAAKRRAERMRA